MATVSNKSRQTYADADEFIQYQIDQARSRIKSTDLLTAIVLTGLLMVSYILIFTIFDHWVVEGGFSAWTRAGMLAVVLTLCAGILYRYVLRPALWHIHPLYAARMLDKTSEGLEGSLLTLVDLQAGGRKSEESIQRTLEKRAAVRLADVHVDEAIDRRLLVRLTAAMFVVTAITCLYAVFSPKSISLLRPLSVANASVATRTVIDAVKPGSGKVPGGSHLDIIADVSGVIPEEMQVLYSTEDRRFVDEPLIMRATDDPHRFQATMIGEGDRGLRQNFSYRVVAGDATSDTFSIVVEQPPTAQVVEVRYEYPNYMGLPNRTDASGTIEAWEGSTVMIIAESSVQVETALLQLSDEAAFKAKGEEVRMDIRDRTLTAKLTLNVREDGTTPKFYRIQVFDADGHSDPEPVVYALEIRRDQAPVVKLHDPSRDLQVPANAVIPLLVEAEDPDFVLRSVTLHYSVNGRQIQPAEILLDTTRSVMPKRWMNTHEFRLEPLNLKAGDVVTYHVQARDNRPPLGNQGRTADLNLQILGAVSDAEAQEQLRLDREIQEQQRKNLEGMPENPAEPGNEPAENQLPDGNDPQPMPDTDGPTQENAANDPLNEKPGEENNNAPGIDQQQATDPNTQQPAATEPTAKPNEGSETRPGNESPAQSPKRKMEDDEALQKLIEEMNRRREQDGESDRSDASSGQQSKAADATATKNKPNEDSKDGNDSSSSAEDMSSEPSDSATTTENKEEKSGKSGVKDENTKEPGETKEGTNGNAEEKGDTSAKEVGDGGKSEPKSKTNEADTPSEASEKMPGEKSATETKDASEPGSGNDSNQPNEQQGTTQPKSTTTSEMKENPDNKQPQDNSSAQGTQQEKSKAGSDEANDSELKNVDQKSNGSPDSKNKSGMDDKGKEKDNNAPNDDAGDQQGSKANSPDKQDDSRAGSNDKKEPEDPSSRDGKKSAGNDQKAANQKSAAEAQADNQDKTAEKSGQKNNDQMNGEKSAQENGEKSSNSKEKQASNSDSNKSSEKGEKSSSKSNEKSGQQTGDKAGQDGNEESKAANNDMKSNNSNDAQQKSGDQKSKNGNEEDSKSGNEQSGDSKAGGSRSSDSKSGNKSGDSGSKSGGEKSSGSKSGESKSADSKSGGEKSAGDQAGDKGSDSKSGDAKSSEKKSEEGKSGDGESSGSKSADSNGGDEKSSEGKAGGEKTGGEKSTDGKAGDSKSGDSKSGGDKAGGKDSGGGKSGGKAGEGKSSSSSKGGQNSSGSGKSGPSQSNVQSASGPAELGGGNAPSGDQQAEGMEGEKGREGGEGLTSDSPPVKNDPAVDEAAEAASLALKRLEKDLDRGSVNQKLLDELGWTAEELTAFKERLQKQLEERKLNEQQEKERSLSQKSFEEMLKSLDVKSAGKAREGRTDRDRDQQDTTNRQQVVPKRYQQWYEMYQRSISEGNKPAKGSNP